MHDLLKRQLERCLGAGDVPAGLDDLLRAVSQTYETFDGERKALEARLESESSKLARASSELRALLQAFPDRIFHFDADGTIRDFKGEIADLSIQPREFLGRKIHDVLPDPVGRRIEDAIARVLDTQALVSVDFGLPVRGGVVLSEAHLVPLSESRVLCAVRNVTEQRRVEESFAEERAFLRQILDLNPNLIFAKDRNGTFTFANRALADAYGTTVEKIVGKNDSNFNPDAAEVAQYLRDDLEVMNGQREKIVLEETITDAGGVQRYLQTIKRPLVSHDGSVNQILGVATDITERKKLEKLLLQSQKMEAVGLLAGGVAHDFNNLLNVILGYAELAHDAIPEKDPARESVAEITTAANRAAELTRKLLAFSRRQVLQVKPFDVHVVLDDFTKLLSRVVGENVEIAIEHWAEPLVIRADPGQIEQVLLNLCTNAKQAMPSGGKLSLATARRRLGEDAARAADVSPGEYVTVRVTDTGVGMDARTLAHVFEPFFTTKHQGTGLGLSTVYGIVRQHGGFLEIRSVLGEGTTFEVCIPEDAAPPAKETPVAAPLPVGKETLLVVEDEAGVRNLLAAALTRFGYSVLTAKSGEEAIEEFEAWMGRIDLVILDTVLPKLSGPDAYRRMKTLKPDLKAILMSGYAPESAGLEEILEADGLRFLAKPFKPRTLAEAVREILGPA